MTKWLNITVLTCSGYISYGDLSLHAHTPVSNSVSEWFRLMVENTFCHIFLLLPLITVNKNDNLKIIKLHRFVWDL